VLFSTPVLLVMNGSVFIILLPFCFFLSTYCCKTIVIVNFVLICFFRKANSSDQNLCFALFHKS
jgi:hypothetical protein